MANVKLSQITASPSNAIAGDQIVAVHGGNTDFLFTPAQIQAAFTNFSTTTVTPGLVVGSNNLNLTTTFLRADGTWQVPPGQVTYGNNQLLYSNNTGVLQAVPAGTAGQMLTFNGANWTTTPPTWTTPPGGAAFGNNNLLYSDNVGTVHQLAAGAAGLFLQSGGTNWSTSPPLWAAAGGGGGSGNVVGPGTSVVGHIATYNNTTGTLIQDSNGWTINASNHLVPLTDNAFDIGITGTNRARTVYATAYSGGTFNGTTVTGTTFTGTALTLNGATSGQITFGVPATVTSYSMTWPSAAPASSSGIVVSAAGAVSFSANLGIYGNVTDTNSLYYKDNSGVLQKVAAGTAGQVLTVNGANWTTNPPTWTTPAASGAITSVKITRFQTGSASGGTFTYTPTSGMKYAIVEVVGGGGAGGGLTSGTGQNGAAGGGGAGAYARKLVTFAQVTPSITVTIGAGGTGVTNGAGTAGGTTSFGTLCVAVGGGGGNQLSVGSGPGAGGYGPSGTGDVLITGGAGVSGFYGPAGYFTQGGGGGNSLLGGGAAATFASAGNVNPGLPASGFGGGGSGASFNDYTALSTLGGNGMSGICIVTEYI